MNLRIPHLDFDLNFNKSCLNLQLSSIHIYFTLLPSVVTTQYPTSTFFSCTAVSLLSNLLSNVVQKRRGFAQVFADFSFPVVSRSSC